MEIHRNMRVVCIVNTEHYGYPDLHTKGTVERVDNDGTVLVCWDGPLHSMCKEDRESFVYTKDVIPLRAFGMGEF